MSGFWLLSKNEQDTSVYRRSRKTTGCDAMQVLMHNGHSSYASRETTTSRFEPLDHFCGDRRGKKRHQSVRPTIAQSTGGQPRPSARAFHVSRRIGNSLVFRV